MFPKRLNENRVIIPETNGADLMLDEEIVQSVKRKEFHIWAVEDIDQIRNINWLKSRNKR